MTHETKASPSTAYREPAAPASHTDAGEQARRTTRGSLVIAVAKLYFMLTGFAQPLLLVRFLGVEGYGLYGSVLNTISILNNVVVAGSIQAMSRAVSREGTGALRRGVLLHLVLGLTLASLLAGTADFLGRTLLDDPSLPPLLQTAALIVGNYSVYAALVGGLNGQQRFVAQASLDITYSTLRTALVVGFGAVWGVSGSIRGFAYASGIITALAFVVLFGKRNAAPTAAGSPGNQPALELGPFAKQYLTFFVPVLLYQVLLNGVLLSDLLLFKGLLGRRGVALEDVNALTGIYKAVQTFALLPYQLLQAVTLTIFPAVAKLDATASPEESRRLVTNALRFSVLILGALLVPLVALAPGALGLAFPARIQEGSGALRVLSVGMGCYALATISTTILVALKRTRAATGIMAATLLVLVLGDLAGISLASHGSQRLVGLATGSSIGAFVGLALAAFALHRSVGTFVPLATLLRTVLSCALACGALVFVPWHGKVATLALSLVGVGLYALALLLTGEVQAQDRAALGGILGRFRKPAAR